MCKGHQGSAGSQGPRDHRACKGLAGTAGPVGPQGIQSPAGIGIHFKGREASVAALPANLTKGDAYLVQADDSLGAWDNGTNSWVNRGSIQGPQGPQVIQLPSVWMAGPMS